MLFLWGKCVARNWWTHQLSLEYMLWRRKKKALTYDSVLVALTSHWIDKNMTLDSRKSIQKFRILTGQREKAETFYPPFIFLVTLTFNRITNPVQRLDKVNIRLKFDENLLVDLRRWEPRLKHFIKSWNWRTAQPFYKVMKFWPADEVKAARPLFVVSLR